jgi:hypothetical protein
MDWSLLQPHAKKRFLRDTRAYKKVWYYYTAMVIDVILRWNWVFYIAYTHDVQHNSIASFLVAFSEVSRRGMWTLFRVENEHCANVTRFKASRDVPLPYPVPDEHADLFTRPHSESSPEIESQSQTSSSLRRNRSRTTAAEGGQAQDPGENTLRRRLTRVFAEAHTQDFEKKRKPGAGDGDEPANVKKDPSTDEEDAAQNSSDEEDDDDDIEDEADAMNAEDLLRRGETRDDV